MHQGASKENMKDSLLQEISEHKSCLSKEGNCM